MSRTRDPSTASAVHPTQDLRSTGVFGAVRAEEAAEAEEPGDGTGGAQPLTERYVDRGRVGRGGMGSVHRVFDRALLRQAAVKVLHRDLAQQPRHVRRFVDEAQITGQLDHPNVVPIHELGLDDAGNHYFSMKLVEGRTLDQVIAALGPSRLEPEGLGELLQVFVKICDAVAFAHHRGVVHRDLKPLNVMVGGFGEVYLMDWGLAYPMPRGTGGADASWVRLEDDDGREAATGDQSVFGTPRYMAPEQLDEEGKVDERTDVFALGGILYHVLTGHAPFTAEKYFSLLVQVMSCEIPPPEKACPEGHLVPSGLSRIAMRALAPEPADRHASALELKAEVERFLHGAWHVPTRRFAPGEVIVREGEVGDCAYVIVEGRCAAWDDGGRERRLLREMGPGEVFGETAVFGERPRTATVEAVDEVRLLVVDRELLASGLGLGSWMGVFVKALADRFCEVDERLRQLERER